MPLTTADTTPAVSGFATITSSRRLDVTIDGVLYPGVNVSVTGDGACIFKLRRR